MTILVAARDAGRAGGWRPSPLARLAWATWRQHRAMLIGLAAFTAVAAGYEVLYGLEAHGVTRYRCVGPGPALFQCQAFFESTYAVWFSGFLVPLAFGIFAGAPLLARDYVSGTVRFAWTQGVGRTRQTVAKLALTALPVLAAGALLGGLDRWAAQPPAGQSAAVFNGWISVIFASTPATEAGAAVLCFAVGVLAGALARRVVPAMVSTSVVIIPVAALGYGRFYHWMLGIGARRAADPSVGSNLSTARAANPLAPGGRQGLDYAVGRTDYAPAFRWLSQGWYTDVQGHPLRGAALRRVLDHPLQLTRLHDMFWVTYQPVSRYWLFQSVQGGAELLLALLLGALAIGLLQRRKA